MVAVRFFIREVSQRLSGVGRCKGVWVEFWGIGRASLYRALALPITSSFAIADAAMIIQTERALTEHFSFLGGSIIV